MNKKLSLNKGEIRQIYEWYQAINSVEPFMCLCCPLISNKLKKILGNKMVTDINKSVIENPYVEKRKNKGLAQKKSR